MTFPGLPATTLNGGTSLVITELAAITAPSPIVTPERMVALSPIQTLSPIDIGPFETILRSKGGNDKVL